MFSKRSPDVPSHEFRKQTRPDQDGRARLVIYAAASHAARQQWRRQRPWWRRPRWRRCPAAASAPAASRAAKRAVRRQVLPSWPPDQWLSLCVCVSAGVRPVRWGCDNPARKLMVSASAATGSAGGHSPASHRTTDVVGGIHLLDHAHFRLTSARGRSPLGCSWRQVGEYEIPDGGPGGNDTVRAAAACCCPTSVTTGCSPRAPISPPVAMPSCD